MVPPPGGKRIKLNEKGKYRSTDKKQKRKEVNLVYPLPHLVAHLAHLQNVHTGGYIVFALSVCWFVCWFVCFCAQL